MAAGLIGDGAADGGAPNDLIDGRAGLIVRGAWEAGGGAPGDGRGCARHGTAPVFGASDPIDGRGS
jgi:hypothetical protein